MKKEEKKEQKEAKKQEKKLKKIAKKEQKEAKKQEKEKQENLKKKPKKTLRILLRIVIVLLLCGASGVGTYYVTYKIDNTKRGGDVKLTVTFDDTTTYVIPNINVLDEDKAKAEWPYIMHLSNKGTGTGLYQILISETEDSTIKRDYLSYSLYLSDNEVASGNLKDLKDNILYTSQIEGKKEQEYSLYIWVSKEIGQEEVKEEQSDEEQKEEPKELKYEYKLEFNTIKTGGPGF